MEAATGDSVTVGIFFATAGALREIRSVAIGFGGEDRIFSGFAWNLARHPAQQKKYSLPLVQGFVTRGFGIYLHAADWVF